MTKYRKECYRVLTASFLLREMPRIYSASTGILPTRTIRDYLLWTPFQEIERAVQPTGPGQDRHGRIYSEQCHMGINDKLAV